MLRTAAVLSCALALAACSSAPHREPSEPGSTQASKPVAASPARPGGYYKDDGPGANPPDLDRVQDAQPRSEPLHRFANNPYQVKG